MLHNDILYILSRKGICVKRGLWRKNGSTQGEPARYWHIAWNGESPGVAPFALARPTSAEHVSHQQRRRFTDIPKGSGSVLGCAGGIAGDASGGFPPALAWGMRINQRLRRATAKSVPNQPHQRRVHACEEGGCPLQAETLGQRIARLRKKKQMTQADLAFSMHATDKPYQNGSETWLTLPAHSFLG